MGALLGMGPEENLVPDYLTDLYRAVVSEDDAGMAGPAYRLFFHFRLSCGDVDVFRRGLSAGAS